MFVNPINSFSVSNTYRSNNSQNIKNNQQAPAMKPALNADTVSFGEGKKKHHPVRDLAIATALTGLPAASFFTSCDPHDLESNMTSNTEVLVNLKDFHKCGCDSIPIVIPGGRDTVYIPLPPDTVIVEQPGKTDTVFVEKPGKTDTVFVDRPGKTDTIIVEKWDTTYIDRPVHDTIWIKPDTVYIPNKPHFEINDSINKDIDDFDVPTEGNGDFVWAMQGRNEYLGAQHLLIFNGFFSNEHKSSFVDHAFEEDDIPAGGDKPSKYYYTRYDISSDYENGRRYVEMYVPRQSRHILPDDKKTGAAGWEYVGSFYVKNASVAQTAKLIANDMEGTLKAQFTKNEKRGPGNIYKEWPLDDGSMPKTTIQKVKAFRKDLDNLDD